MKKNWKSILEKHKDYTNSQLAKMFSVSRERIRQVRNQYDLPANVAFSQFTPAERKEIISLAKKGVSTRDISEKIGKCYDSIRKVLVRNNLQPKRRRKYTLIENYFENIDNKNKAYFLGYFVNRGTIEVSKAGNYVSFQIANKSDKILKKFLREIKSNYPIRVIKQTIRDNEFSKYVVTICSSLFVSHLVKAGISPDRSARLQLLVCKERGSPSSKFKYPQYVNPFLSGVRDGNNEVYYNKVKELLS